MAQEIAPDAPGRARRRHSGGSACEWVVLSGGEALMHSNLWALCEQLKELERQDHAALDRPAAQAQRRERGQVVRRGGGLARRQPRRSTTRSATCRAPSSGSPDGRGRTERARRLAFASRGAASSSGATSRDLPNIVEAAQQIGLDQISFLAVDVSSSAFNRPKPWGDERVAEVALSPNEVRRARPTIIERLISRRREPLPPGSSPRARSKLRRIPRYFAALNGDGDFPRDRAATRPGSRPSSRPTAPCAPASSTPPIGNVNDQPLG